MKYGGPSYTHRLHDGVGFVFLSTLLLIYYINIHKNDSLQSFKSTTNKIYLNIYLKSKTVIKDTVTHV